MTMQERYAERLTALGETEVHRPIGTRTYSRKYRVFTRKRGGFYFLGRNGALRYGKNVSQSFAASDGFKVALLAFRNQLNGEEDQDGDAMGRMMGGNR